MCRFGPYNVGKTALEKYAFKFVTLSTCDSLKKSLKVMSEIPYPLIGKQIINYEQALPSFYSRYQEGSP